MRMPELHDLEALRELAADILQPAPGQKVVIMLVDAEPDEEPLESNVLPIYGGPVMTGEEERREAREMTAQVLETLADRARSGEIRHVAIVAGAESNERFMGYVETIFSPGLEEHLAMFLGGCDLLKTHIQDKAMGYDSLIDEGAE
jgi:hypothetical protein